MQQPASAEPPHQNGYKQMIMKRIFTVAAVLSACVCAFGQTDKFERKYDLLVSQLGYDGIGVETVLDNWEAQDSTDAKMLLGRFNYYFTKARTSSIEPKSQKKYLGMEPLITLKDSTGNDIYYYQIDIFDDELYAKAMKVADKAISMHPDKLDFRFLKANAYIAYEKESPDMALSYLKELAAEGAARKDAWNYSGAEVEGNFFEEAMQEYCYSLYAIGTPSAYESFRSLSELLVTLYPDYVGFLSNIGSYYMVARKDYKTALKYYAKVLKKSPDDYTAIKNGVLASRKTGNKKTELKYLELLAKHGQENERVAAKARIQALTSGR